MIKMIAVDVDGTFLSDKRTYDVERFNLLFEQMKDKDIKFVIASGNNISHLQTLMPHHHHDISYISSNGAHVISKGQEISNQSIDHDILIEALGHVEKIQGARIILAGENATYLHDSEPKKVIDYLKTIMGNLATVKDFKDLEETHYYKIGIYMDDKDDQELIDELNGLLNHSLHATSSGHGNVDLISHNTNKSNGLEILAKHYNIDPSEIAAFGDNLNDMEMLEYVGYGYAMENAKAELKAIARYIAPSNNDHGVLSSIEGILKRK